MNDRKKEELTTEFMKKYNLDKADMKNLARYEKVRSEGSMNMYDYQATMNRYNINGGKKLLSFISEHYSDYIDYLEELEDMDSDDYNEDKEKIFEVTVRVWDDYVVEVPAKTKEEAENYIYDNINDVESLGRTSDGGRDVESVEEQSWLLKISLKN